MPISLPFRKFLFQAGTSHEACDSYAAAALSLQQAADLAKVSGGSI
jgi:hypothetical protein